MTCLLCFVINNYVNIADNNISTGEYYCVQSYDIVYCYIPAGDLKQKKLLAQR